MMMKIIAVAVMVITSLFSLMLTILDISSRKNPVPENVADVYDQKEYERWKAYNYENNRLGLISKIVMDVLGLCFMGFNVYALVSDAIPAVNVYVAALIIIVFDTLVSEIVYLPFEYYDTFSIEERYGFNRSTKKLFFVDKIKNLLIELVLMGGLMSAFIAVHQALGVYIIVVFTGIMALFMLMMFVFSPFFQKIFNKFTVLEDGTLKDRLLDLMEKNGCRVKEIKVIDGSKRSSKANAYFTGIGKTKTIVLYDTLLTLMTEDEIVAVFAHEMGHNKHKDTIKGYLRTIITSVMIAVVGFILVSYPEIYKDFGFSDLNYGFAFILLGIAISLVNPFIGFFASLASCKQEFAADKFAADNGYGEALISGLKKLAKDSLTNLSPNKIVVALTYSHPPMSERIAAIEKCIKEKQN